jgi:hypothetical protein
MCLPSIMLKSHLPTNRHETVATSVASFMRIGQITYCIDGRLGTKFPKPRFHGTSERHLYEMPTLRPSGNSSVKVSGHYGVYRYLLSFVVRQLTKD